MADSDMSIMNLRYNQVTQGLEGFGGGSPSWTPLSVGGGGTPAGANTQIQYNNSGAFGASPNFTWTNSSNTLGFGTNGTIVRNGSNELDVNATATLFLNSADGGGNSSCTLFTPTSDTAYYVSVTPSLAIGFNDSAPDASAMLDMHDDPAIHRGFLPPRMTTTNKNAIASPAEGLVVYDLTLHKLSVFTGSAWETVTSA